MLKLAEMPYSGATSLFLSPELKSDILQILLTHCCMRKQVSIPSNHAAAALLKLAEMPYSGATSLFVRVLLNKKYALPHRVIAALVDHFMRFVGETRELPVLWHQSLLVFVQRYRADVGARDRER